MGEVPHVSDKKFSSTEEELEYLRARVREKEQELEHPPTQEERERIISREIKEYAQVPEAVILHEEVIMPQHETLRAVLKLEPETHDNQIDGLLEIVSTKGIRNSLSVAARMKNAHIESDFHRVLVRYVAEGLPDRGLGVPEKIRKSLNTILFEIQPQAHGEGGKDQNAQLKLEAILAPSEQLYAGLLSLISSQDAFTLEIAVPEGTEEVRMYLSVPRPKKELAERLISSVFPNARLSECRGDYNIFNEKGEHAGAYMHFASHAALPLKTSEMFEHDPMNVLLAAFAKIAKHGEGAAIQFVVSNPGDRYNQHYKKVIRQLEQGKSLDEALAVPETDLGEVLRDAGKALFTSKERREEEEKNESRAKIDQVAMEEITRKIKTRIAEVSIRLMASAPTRKRAEELLENLEVPFKQFESPRGNHIEFVKISNWSFSGLSGFVHDYTYRIPSNSIAQPISLAELTPMFHMTAERVTTSRELKKSYAKQTPAPVDMPDQGIVIGLNHYGATETKVRFAPDDRLRHCYVIGQTGTGKTGFLKQMIMQDIHNGDGVAFVDPHGNDIEDILAAVPPERMKDVIYFDPSFTARPMGLNMMEFDRSKPELKTFVVDEIYGVFRKLYSDVPEAFGPMFEQYYRNSVQLVLEDPDTGCTLLEIPRIFADKQFRELKLSRCNNPIITQFWKKIAQAAEGEASLENVTPYITAKFDVFLANEIMRPIVAQEKSAFNFREVIDGRKIFLANLSKGRLGDRNSSLLGLVLVSKFLQAAFSRVDTREWLPPFYLYIDEFQNFATPSIGTILSEARKYKLSLTIAHQFISQIDEKIRDAVIGNVGTKISFRVGTTDAEFLAKQYEPVFSAPDLEHLPFRNSVISLLVNGVPARPFTMVSPDLPAVDYEKVDAMKELSYRTYGRPREEVEEEVRKKFAPPPRQSLATPPIINTSHNDNLYV